MMNETNETKPPRMIWLQWYGDPDDQTGIGIGRPEGVTFHEEQVYANDLCYVRAGKPSPIMQQLLARAEAAEKRVAELEAAQAWRPVTEPPEDIDIEYWTYDRGHIDKMDWTGEHWMMNCTYWYPSHWRPQPPPPTGDNS